MPAFLCLCYVCLLAGSQSPCSNDLSARAVGVFSLEWLINLMGTGMRP